MSKKWLMYALVYVVFYEFAKRDYDGIIRQVLKLFLREISEVITEVCLLE